MFSMFFQFLIWIMIQYAPLIVIQSRVISVACLSKVVNLLKGIEKKILKRIYSFKSQYVLYDWDETSLSFRKSLIEPPSLLQRGNKTYVMLLNPTGLQCIRESPLVDSCWGKHCIPYAKSERPKSSRKHSGLLAVGSIKKEISIANL